MITLVPLSISHLDHIMTWVNDHEVMQYFANRQTDISREEETAYILKMVDSNTDRVFSIFAGKEYVGQCSLNQVYWPARNGRLFIVIKKSAQGHGFAHEAVGKLLQYAREGLGLHKVWLIVRQDNRTSQAMYLSLGFNFEGLLKDEYLVGDRYFDMVRMGVILPSANSNS